jgi:eukaryotic-like serine/threonine-protein kinase
VSDQRQNLRRLYLEFECLRSIPEGINEVHVWFDPILGAERVGKLIDISGLEHDGSLPEPATLETIRHPNVVPVIAAARRVDYRPPLNVVELITPYYPRGSITDALLDGIRFTLSEARAIAQAALRGIAELHDVLNILHRDIKSGNILLVEDSAKAKVADLGLAAKMREDGTTSTAKNPTIYSPPELIGGRLTVESDIYSMGLVLRELVAGPFRYAEHTRASVIQRLERGLCAVPDDDGMLPPFVPTQMRRIVKKATARDPARRYKNAREMNSALARVRLIDWQEVAALHWEAPFGKHGRKMSVSAQKHRDGTYTVTARKFAAVRSRSVGAIRVRSLGSPEVVRLFDKATDEAFKQ